MRCAITGASGFIGRPLCAFLKRLGYQVTPIVRKVSGIEGEHVAYSTDDFYLAFTNCESVIHLAGYPRFPAPNISLTSFRRVNVDLTLELAKIAARSGVRRFVYISSIKVNGEHTLNRRPFSPDDLPNPSGEYARSKADAELGLQRISCETGMELVIIRPPMVYGPGVSGNFLGLIRILNLGIPLPLKLVTAPRAFIALDNLIDFIALCSDKNVSALADGEIFLVSDDDELSVPALFEKLAIAYGCNLRLFSIPVSWLDTCAKVLGKSDVLGRLVNPLSMDTRKVRTILGWRPVTTIDQQLKIMASREGASKN